MSGSYGKVGMRRSISVSCLAVSAVLACCAPAAAAPFGETFMPLANCTAGVTHMQSTSADNSYAAPFAGVLTKWSYQSGPGPSASVKLKVGRAAGGDNITIVGESTVQLALPNVLNTFDTRVPVLAGDILGVYTADMVPCADTSSPAYEMSFVDGDTAPGVTTAFASNNGVRLDVGAIVEPDADQDGFGDETQDACPADATRQAPCDPPDTQITKGTPKKTGKDAVKFKFSSTKAGSTFECRLKGKGLDQAIKRFTPCTSPRRYKKLEPGKYKFFVVATDATGNVDPTPATDRFRIIKR